MSEQKYRGVVKTYDSIKGFGFITLPLGEGSDVFVYFKDFVSKSIESSVVAGSHVEFFIEGNTKKTRRAKQVSLIG